MQHSKVDIDIDEDDLHDPVKMMRAMSERMKQR